MPSYKVMIDDNFHYQEADERREHGTYGTLEEALAVCRGIVDKSLDEQYRPNIKAAALYDLYMSFGDDPFIVVVDGVSERGEFSAWTYAKSRCDEICEQR